MIAKLRFVVLPTTVASIWNPMSQQSHDSWPNRPELCNIHCTEWQWVCVPTPEVYTTASLLPAVLWPTFAQVRMTFVIYLQERNKITAYLGLLTSEFLRLTILCIIYNMHQKLTECIEYSAKFHGHDMVKNSKNFCTPQILFPRLRLKLSKFIGFNSDVWNRIQFKIFNKFDDYFF